MMTIYVAIGVLALIAISYYLYSRKKDKKKESETVPAGLQCFDANGNIILDTNSKTFKYFGTITVGSNGGSVTDGRFTSIGGSPFAFCVNLTGDGDVYADSTTYSYSFSGNTLTFSGDSHYTRTYIYGVA